MTREIRALADKGGVVRNLPDAVPSAEAASPGNEDLIRHIEHAAKVCGEDHIGLGTDGPAVRLQINEETEEAAPRILRGPAASGAFRAPGESADVLNLVEGYNDVGRYATLAADLKARGLELGADRQVARRQFRAAVRRGLELMRQRAAFFERRPHQRVERRLRPELGFRLAHRGRRLAGAEAEVEQGGDGVGGGAAGRRAPRPRRGRGRGFRPCP